MREQLSGDELRALEEFKREAEAAQRPLHVYYHRVLAPKYHLGAQDQIDADGTIVRAAAAPAPATPAPPGAP